MRVPTVSLVELLPDGLRAGLPHLRGHRLLSALGDLPVLELEPDEPILQERYRKLTFLLVPVQLGRIEPLDQVGKLGSGQRSSGRLGDKALVLL